ncbi:MAG: 6-phosphogluconolactonase [bacterium]|mgnify:CR=1 FL=1|nr:6-phosphogluconolactonase [bacterium]
MKQASIEVVDAQVFSHNVSEEIKFSIEDAINRSGQCTIALSGGKTPAAIYRILSKPPLVESIPWSKVILIWGDERWVAKDNHQSNYNLVDETLLSKLIDKKPKVIAVDTTLKDVETGAKDYEEKLRKISGLKADEIPSIDILLLGIGEDGHTASLFPGSAALKENKRICLAVTVKDAEIKERITITFPVIIAAKKVFFIVTGEGKADIIKNILEGNEDEMVYPAMIYKKAKGNVTWFLDNGAASKLKT